MGKKMIKKDFVNVRIVLDRSGSMGSAVKETIDSINTFISEQQNEKVNGSITVVELAELHGRCRFDFPFESILSI